MLPVNARQLVMSQIHNEQFGTVCPVLNSSENIHSKNRAVTSTFASHLHSHEEWTEPEQYWTRTLADNEFWCAMDLSFTFNNLPVGYWCLACLHGTSIKMDFTNYPQGCLLLTYCLGRMKTGHLYRRSKRLWVFGNSQPYIFFQALPPPPSIKNITP